MQEEQNQHLDNTEPNETQSTEVEQVAEAQQGVGEQVEEVVQEVTSEVQAVEDEEEVVEEKVPYKKSRVGVVVSNKMDKSIIVKVTRRVRHPLYKKYFYKSKKFMAHDAENTCNVGDTVRIEETRPMSARKRWALDTIIERAK